MPAHAPLERPAQGHRAELAVQPELFLVGTVEEKLVGSVMAGYEGHRGWVNYLAVAPRHRGRGYARTLMQHVETLLFARGCPKVSLLVRNSNREALDFYRHLGYAQDEAVSLGKRLIRDDAA